MKDIDKIKEAAEREDRRAASVARGDAQLIAGGGRDDDCALLLAAVPDLLADRVALLAEIERLTNEAATSYAVIEVAFLTLGRGDIEGARYMLRGEIERIAARPVETIDLRVEGAAELKAADAAIDALQTLAREGWERARDQANAAGDEESEAYAIKILAGLAEATS